MQKIREKIIALILIGYSIFHASKKKINSNSED